MRKISLFSGIGGIDLAAHWAGMETVLFCEREPFGQAVLRKHWPDVPIIDDVFKVTREEADKLGIGTIDIVSAGFPCQPFSHAGKRAGTEDERYLWPEVVRVLSEFLPTWFVGENVAGLLSMAEPVGPAEVVNRTVNRWPEEDFFENVFTQSEIMLLNGICSDLENLGYEVAVFEIPAAAVGASHLRDRIFILGYAEHYGSHGAKIGRGTDPTSDDNQGRAFPSGQPAGTSGRADNAAMGDSERSRRYGESWRRADKQFTDGHSGMEGWAMADTAGSGLHYRERSGFAANAEEVGAGWGYSGFERCCSLVDANGERCEERNTSTSSEGMGYHPGSVTTGGNNRPTKSGMGGSADVLSSWLDGGINPLDLIAEFIATYPQPALLGQPQHEWEPPRVATGVPNRAPRLKALGNAVNPLQIYLIMQAIKWIDDQLSM